MPTVRKVTILDSAKALPEAILLSPMNHVTTDVNATDLIAYESVAYYILDSGQIELFFKWIKQHLKIYEILIVLGISLLDKTPVKELFSKIDNNDVNEQILTS